MATDIQEMEPGAVAPSSERRTWPRGHRKWIAAALGFLVLAATVGYVAENEVRVDTSFDLTHHSLDTAESQTRTVLSGLAAVRRDLTAVTAQVTSDSVALTQDRSQLQGAEKALINAQQSVSQQTSTISDLHACLGGVEQALNALAVSDLSRAIAALNAVSLNCANAVTTND